MSLEEMLYDGDFKQCGVGFGFCAAIGTLTRWPFIAGLVCLGNGHMEIDCHRFPLAESIVIDYYDNPQKSDDHHNEADAQQCKVTVFT